MGGHCPGPCVRPPHPTAPRGARSCPLGTPGTRGALGAGWTWGGGLREAGKPSGPRAGSGAPGRSVRGPSARRGEPGTRDSARPELAGSSLCVETNFHARDSLPRALPSGEPGSAGNPVGGLPSAHRGSRAPEGVGVLGCWGVGGLLAPERRAWRHCPLVEVALVAGGHLATPQLGN